MRLGDRLGQFDRLQQSLGFKIVASSIVIVLAVGALIWYSVAQAAARSTLHTIDTSRYTQPLTPPKEGETPDPAREAAAKAVQEKNLAAVKTVNAIMERRVSVGGFALGCVGGAGVALAVIWLGLGLTYLAILGAAAMVVFPIWRFGPPSIRGWAVFIGGALALAASFTALTQGLRVLLSASTPVMSIARNVVNEAVRMKVSLVFIVLLILGLASLPNVLDDTAPLRYRVQSFLTYGAGGAFWVIAVLSIFLACGSVAFEQRDKIIWQTMTKPVRAWQYILGKWLGVSAMAAVLLGVSCTGIYLFTEYLRQQPAQGESAPFVSDGPGPISNDRLILETQVLTARLSVRPTLPELDPKAIEEEVAKRIERAKAEDPLFHDNQTERDRFLLEVEREFAGTRLTVNPGEWKQFTFDGLAEARRNDAALTLRYKVNAGADAPTDLYRLTFYIAGGEPFIRETRLGQMLTEPLSPAAVQLKTDAATGRVAGSLELSVFNGDIERRIMNKLTIAFPPDGFEVFFPVGGFMGNFMRVVAVMWMKIAMLAMLAITASTALSFAVSCMLSFGAFLAAEGTQFLARSLESYSPEDIDRSILWWRYPIIWTAQAVTEVFGFYANLRPTDSLVEGRLVGWSTIAEAIVVLGAITAALWAIGSAIFRKRELAIYSGN